ncbi:MAG: hypothetical protein K6C13_03195 [Oscillospiraceae bacterium]|nr:hypothetical protein [Oscillospiraceae bacterium]
MAFLFIRAVMTADRKDMSYLIAFFGNSGAAAAVGSAFDCIAAGLIRLLFPAVLLIFLKRWKNVPVFPAFISFGVCYPVFILAGIIRSGFDTSDPTLFYIKQGVLYGIFEEGIKLAVLYYLSEHYDRKGFAVSCGIGHCAFEDVGAAFSCFALVGSDSIHPLIFWFNLWASVEGIAFCTALSVLLYCGIRKERMWRMLAAAVVLHAVSNAVGGVFSFSDTIVIVLRTVITAAVCFAAYLFGRDEQVL